MKLTPGVNLFSYNLWQKFIKAGSLFMVLQPIRSFLAVLFFYYFCDSHLLELGLSSKLAIEN